MSEGLEQGLQEEIKKRSFSRLPLPLKLKKYEGIYSDGLSLQKFKELGGKFEKDKTVTLNGKLFNCTIYTPKSKMIYSYDKLCKGDKPSLREVKFNDGTLELYNPKNSRGCLDFSLFMLSLRSIELFKLSKSII